MCSPTIPEWGAAARPSMDHKRYAFTIFISPQILFTFISHTMFNFSLTIFPQSSVSPPPHLLLPNLVINLMLPPTFTFLFSDLYICECSMTTFSFSIHKLPSVHVIFFVSTLYYLFSSNPTEQKLPPHFHTR